MSHLTGAAHAIDRCPEPLHLGQGNTVSLRVAFRVVARMVGGSRDGCRMFPENVSRYRSINDYAHVPCLAFGVCGRLRVFGGA